MKSKKIIKKRIATRNLVETVLVPEHEERTTSKEFVNSRKRLKEDGHYQCWICGTTEDLHVHHFLCEYSLSNMCNYDELKKACEKFDIYGYGKLLQNKPITSVDDIRNMMVLCQEHHTGGVTKDGSANGIHNLSFPVWVSQKICSKNNTDPVPDNFEEIEQIRKSIIKQYGEEDN